MGKKIWGLAFVLMGLTFGAQAADEMLNASSSVPLGERVAAYLQGYYDTFGPPMADKEGLGAPPAAHLFYSAAGRVITVLVSGKAGSAEQAKPALALVQKILLSAGKGVKRDFNLDLGPKDLALLYLAGPRAQALLSLKEGVYAPPGSAAAPSTRPTP
ncbi:MAG TPA: hypothetical protein VMU88_07020 [bacterium]|nr:hypothetical protein [bacterium]